MEAPASDEREGILSRLYPADSQKKLPDRTVEYVIVGGGLTAAGAVKGIRERLPTCSILVWLRVAG